MIKNLYLCLKNMQKHFSNELLGDDSLSNYTKFMKKNNKYKKKKKLFLYTWTYDGKKYL